MKLRRVLAVILALLIAAGIYILLDRKEDNSRGAVTLWYDKNSPLAGETEALVKSYNADIKRKTLPVEIKCFDSEEELAAAYEVGSPDILLCSHLRAFSLYGRSKLTDISAEETFSAPVYPKNISSRNGSIGKSFFPIGISVPVLALNTALAPQTSFDGFEALFAAASDYTAENGKPFLSVSSAAELYYIYLLRFSSEFGGEFDAINGSEQTLALYNVFAEAAFDGSIAFLGEDTVKYFENGAIACAILPSDRLKGLPAERLCVSDIPAPDGSDSRDTVGEAYGLAVTNGGCRSTRDTAAFITWMFENGRASQAAADGRLVPAAESVSIQTDEVGTMIAETAKSGIISLPKADDDYILNRDAFEERFLEKIEKLLP